MGPAVGRQPQADGVGDGLGNVESGRIGHPRGDPLVVTSIGQNTLSRTGPRAHHPHPPPAQSLPHHRADPRLWTASSGEKGSWIGNEELLPHILRILGMLSRESLEPTLVHSMRAHLNKLQNNEDLFIDACRKVLHHLNLADQIPILTTEEFASGDLPAPPNDPDALIPSELPQTLSRSATQARIALSILDFTKNRPDLPALLHLWLTNCDLDKYMAALRVMQFLPEGILEDLLPDLAVWGDTDRAYPYVRNILGALTPEVLQNMFYPAILRELARTSSWSDHDRSWWMYATLLDSIRMIDEAWNLIYVARLHPQAKVREMANELTEHLDDES